MTATITNQSLNTSTPTNQVFSSSDLTWDEATFTWDEGAGTWDNPYKMSNENIHSASLSNQSKS